MQAQKYDIGTVALPPRALELFLVQIQGKQERPSDQLVVLRYHAGPSRFAAASLTLGRSLRISYMYRGWKGDWNHTSEVSPSRGFRSRPYNPPAIPSIPLFSTHFRWSDLNAASREVPSQYS